MAHKIYAFFYAIYAWSERIFFVLLGALLIIPFMSFDNRGRTWLLLLFIALSLPLAAKFSELVCRRMLATQAKKAASPFSPAAVDEELEQHRRPAIARRQASIDAEARHAAAVAEQQRRLETAWWVNRNRF